MSKRYGTPPPPLARRPLVPRPHLPKTRGAIRASLRRGGTWARIVLVGGLAAVLITTISTAFATPERPHLDVEGDPVILGSVAFERPRGWALAAETADLTRPIVLFAPQADAAAPPVTITFYAVDATDQYDAALAAGGGTSPSDYDLLETLVLAYAKDAKLPAAPVTERSAYNISANSSIVRVNLIASWPETLFPWRPPTASATPTPSSESPGVSQASTPTPTIGPASTPTPRPLAYPDLGPSADRALTVVQAYYLPDGEFFTGTDQSGRVFRKLVVVTLTHAADLDPVVAAEARTTFDRLTSTISFD